MTWVLTVFSFWMGFGCLAQAATPGYIQDVRAERDERFYEIFLFSDPTPVRRSLQDVIFNPELSAEFRSKYRDRFGHVDTDSIDYQRSDYERLESFKSNNPKIEADSANRKTFAEYMMKRLTEWHVDNYIKSEPAMRPVYEAKERLKKVEVRVNKETKLEAHYSLAGNTMDVILENPYCETKWTMQMDPKAFGPTGVQQNRLLLGRPVTSRLRAENSWTDVDARAKFELIKSHSPVLSSSYGVSAAYKENNDPRDTRVSLGMSYAF